MAENKTKATGASVDGYMAAIADPGRRSDCEALAKLMAKVAGQPPKLWGTSIVGLGRFTGREELLSKLGKHKMGKGCLYIGRMTDIDVKVLEQLLKKSVAETKKQHG